MTQNTPGHAGPTCEPERADTGSSGGVDALFDALYAPRIDLGDIVLAPLGLGQDGGAPSDDGGAAVALEQELSRIEDIPEFTFYPPRMSAAQARERVERTREGISARRWCRYVVYEHPSGAALGTLGFALAEPPGCGEACTVAFFYALLPAARGRGVVTRALAHLIEQIKDRRVRVEVEVIMGNRASEAVAERLGFELLRTIELEHRRGTLPANVFGATYP